VGESPESGSTDPEPARHGSIRSQAGGERLLRRQIVGILLIAAVILVFTLLRARWHDLFPQGWWRW
jgi:hypothetical protein